MPKTILIQALMTKRMNLEDFVQYIKIGNPDLKREFRYKKDANGVILRPCLIK